MKIYLRYQDDGPNGICGQACSITNPWDVLHVFDDEDSAYWFKRNLEKNKSRENARITMQWDSENNSLVPEVVVHKTTTEVICQK